jgi:hypothetical protein
MLANVAVKIKLKIRLENKIILKILFYKCEGVTTKAPEKKGKSLLYYYSQIIS